MKGLRKAGSALAVTTLLTLTLNLFTANAAGPTSYTVKSGDTLWKISNAYSITVSDLKLINGLTTDALTVGQMLKLSPDTHTYTVQPGDSLWYVSNKFGVAIADLKALNSLISDSIVVGQVLKTMPDTVTYTVKPGDILYNIASKFGASVADIKKINKLTGDVIYVGQALLIPYKMQAVQTSAPSPAPTPSQPPSATAPVLGWPSVTYIVQSGDSATSIAKKFAVPVNDILKYNYMTLSDWFDAGEKIAINGYAPRNYAVRPGQDSGPTRYGRLADWFLDGQYILKRNAILTITDLQTGKAFKVKVMGGYNHADIEPLTAGDTNMMKQLWHTWNWSPRPVVVFTDGMNIASSLSGMPHSYDTTPDNGVTGHFDLYLLNSIPHASETSQSYVDAHYANVYKAAGKGK